MFTVEQYSLKKLFIKTKKSYINQDIHNAKRGTQQQQITMTRATSSALYSNNFLKQFRSVDLNFSRDQKSETQTLLLVPQLYNKN